MSWQSSLSWKNAKARAVIINNVRTFFENRNVIEVETPILSRGTVTDVHLEPFITRYNFLDDSNGDCASPFYLQTSPEFLMKRLLASGYGCIYQICKSFRHEEFGRHHNPEFTMLEWYRIGFDHFDLMAEVSDLLVDVLKCKPCIKMSYQEVFMEVVGIDPLEVTKDQLTNLIKKNGKSSPWIEDERDIDILLQFLFSEIVEPSIGLDAPCFIYNFPSSQASLAKISTLDPRVAERFECYYLGLELVNGFHELTDAKLQVNRFKVDNKIRVARGLSPRLLDESLIGALTIGIPDCAGVALGMDRLVMLALKQDHISKVLSYSIVNA